MPGDNKCCYGSGSGYCQAQVWSGWVRGQELDNNNNNNNSNNADKLFFSGLGF